jgi:uncharacterized membrane protein YhiD involved in acid resistance
MMSELAGSLGLASLDLGRFEVALVRLITAAMLGSFLGYRVWRRFIPNTVPPAREIAQAQTLIAVAGALMVIVIGQSTARAFGLVGLGGFIRFRSGIKDTRDAAGMFVMIGIGMACGLGALPMAVMATSFASAVFAVFDASQRGRLRPRRLTIEIEHPQAAWKRIQLALPGSRSIELPGDNEVASGRLVMEAILDESIDAAGVLALLEARQVPGIRSVNIDEKQVA